MGADAGGAGRAARVAEPGAGLTAPGEVHVRRALLTDAVRLIARGAVSFDAANPRRVVVAGYRPAG